MGLIMYLKRQIVDGDRKKMSGTKLVKDTTHLADM